ncbi:MAG: WXG100 family type VII secretion target [Actinomycetaceae bacterium]|nr:WXG100 family type VII secretion target [Actinomycetaceae bacterium]MDU0969647.1 WXG100 family type VII secretion target [Actinomycetaceae bacterium]
MAHYLVDSAELTRSASATLAIADHIRSEVTAMMGQLNALESSWTGQAQVAFADCATRWHAAQTQVEGALQQISTALAQASATYEDAEAQATGLFAG